MECLPDIPRGTRLIFVQQMVRETGEMPTDVGHVGRLTAKEISSARIFCHVARRQLPVRSCEQVGLYSVSR